MESESDFGGNSEDEEDDDFGKTFERAEDTPEGDDGDGDGGGGAGYGGKGSGDINGEDITFSESAIPVRPRRKVGRGCSRASCLPGMYAFCWETQVLLFHWSFFMLDWARRQVLMFD